MGAILARCQTLPHSAKSKTKGRESHGHELEVVEEKVDDIKVCRKEPYTKGALTIVVLGASGDLAKKKTYPSLMDLYINGLLPKHVTIMGFARSDQSIAKFREHLMPWLKKEASASQAKAFLARCEYFSGVYDSAESFAKLDGVLKEFESERKGEVPTTNRLFYFAIPPDAFLAAAQSIKASASATGFTRLIVEKPFGHDLDSAKKLATSLGKIFSEDYIYRIDHYLGKEIIQNLTMFRFGNRFLDPVMNKDHVANVRITFKEDFGTEGRGGYFTNYGIIRDIIQNHLMQVLSVLAMERPSTLVGPNGGNNLRDAKVEVLKAIKAIKAKNVVVGQYTANEAGKPGYMDDDSIKDKEKAAYVPTFAVVVLYINNARWKGVPFLIKAGKALDERKAEIRIQFKDPDRADELYGVGSESVGKFHRNELVMRLQPDEVIYMKTTCKKPGLEHVPFQAELDLTYSDRFSGAYNPSAYTRLILEALRGNQGDFVRGDEITTSWKLFDPLLKELETGRSKQKPLPYKYGSRGPEKADKLFSKIGFEHNEDYQWDDGKD